MKLKGFEVLAIVFFSFLVCASGFSAVEPLFDSWPNYASERKPTAVYSVDMDQDGDLDFVVCHAQGGVNGPSVIIFENNGAGAFSRGLTLQLLGSPVSVVAKDLDWDSDVDIVTANSNTHRVSIFKSRGPGNGFEFPLDCPVGRVPLSVAVDSLNFDSLPSGRPQFLDILTANYGSGTGSILINHGAASFPAESIKVLGVGPRSVVIFDIDNDGDRDFAASISTNLLDRKIGGNGIVVLENVGGRFDDSARIFYPIRDTLFNPFQLITADFNNDGYLDMALADSSTLTTPINRAVVCIFRNRQDGTFDTLTPSVRYPVGLGCRSIFAADLDGDGDTDIAAANAGSNLAPGNTVSILKNNGSGSFAPKVDYLTPVAPFWIDGGDYDRDGDVDLAIVSINGHSVAVLRNRGDGSYEGGTEYSTGSGSLPQHIQAADLDADGDVDLAIVNQVLDQISIHKNNGNGSFAAPVFFNANSRPRGLALADLDGDGDLDLAIANQASNDISILRNNGTGSYTSVGNYAAGNAPYSLVARDLDGDNDSDLAVANFGENTISVFKNNSNATFAPRLTYPAGFLPIFIASADFDGDGDRDLATADLGFNDAPDSVSIYFNNGAGSFNMRTSYWVGSGPTTVIAEDLDGDGDFDLGVAVPGTPSIEDNAMAVLLNNGGGIFAPAVRYTPAPGCRALAATDMDLDGDKDILTVDGSVNSVSFLENIGNATFAPSFEYGAGLAPIFLAVADLDNDGDRDLAVTNQQMVTNATHGGLTILKNLTNGLCFAPGDLNGDGGFSPVDVVLELNCIFQQIGNCPLCVTDANCDSNLTAADGIALLMKIFSGTPLPCP